MIEGVQKDRVGMFPADYVRKQRVRLSERIKGKILKKIGSMMAQSVARLGQQLYGSRTLGILEDICFQEKVFRKSYRPRP